MWSGVCMLIYSYCSLFQHLHIFIFVFGNKGSLFHCSNKQHQDQRRKRLRLLYIYFKGQQLVTLNLHVIYSLDFFNLNNNKNKLLYFYFAQEYSLETTSGRRINPVCRCAVMKKAFCFSITM